MADDIYLEVRNLTKMFGDFKALDDVSLSVERGAFVCFLGPSGCGKTTLLRAIAGLDIQTYGEIIQDGRDISDLPPSERDFGIVFQSYALFPNLSVRDNVAFGLTGLGLRKAEIAERVERLLEQVGLPEQTRKYPAQLSGGQQQRVALARALATEPNLLLLDEPLSALDAKVRVRLRQQLKDLQRRLGLTTIMVTHDQEEALSLADHIVVLSQGKVEQVGTPVEIYSDPANAFVADFVGEMNFIEAGRVGDAQVRIGGMPLKADTSRINGAQRVLAAIRPEDVLVRGVAAGDENAIELEIRHVEFCGGYMRLTLGDALLGDAQLRADISMNLARGIVLAERSRLLVSLPPERLRVYPQP